MMMKMMALLMHDTAMRNGFKLKFLSRHWKPLPSSCIQKRLEVYPARPAERRSPSSCEIAIIDQGPHPSNNTQARVNGTDRMPPNRRDHNSPEIYPGQQLIRKRKRAKRLR